MTSRLHRIVPVAVAIAFVLPAASAGAQDFRSPDAQAPWVRVAPASIDLRSPDAQAPFVRTEPSSVKTDLRSPDAIDGAAGSRRGVDVAPSTVLVSAPAVDGSFSWGDAGVGAGILVALLILSAGGYALMAAHRRSAGGAPLAH
jgi:hypothetical protein